MMVNPRGAAIAMLKVAIPIMTLLALDHWGVLSYCKVYCGQLFRRASTS
jgi:hypothetical protein